VCGEGRLAEKVVSHDVGPLLGMPHVEVEHLPALACAKCGAVTVAGEMLDAVSMLLAALLLRQTSLDATEVRYLRRMAGDTQEEFARRLEVDRATVNRWENTATPITGTPAYAIRSHVFFRLRRNSSVIEAVGDAFIAAGRARKRSRRGAYRIDAAALAAA
jgi:hypothetical protein